MNNNTSYYHVAALDALSGWLSQIGAGVAGGAAAHSFVTTGVLATIGLTTAGVPWAVIGGAIAGYSLMRGVLKVREARVRLEECSSNDLATTVRALSQIVAALEQRGNGQERGSATVVTQGEKIKALGK